MNLGPADALVVNNALNEICNGVHLDGRDFQPRMGIDREQAFAVLRMVNGSIKVMRERRLAEGKEGETAGPSGGVTRGGRDRSPLVEHPVRSPRLPYRR
ncbi:hypothetical protein [Streptosporangium sp. NPDC051022]|uniref:hypothetical protein n=1 Tax=Streptosporangium sp. NPDC051022 TaxID=3155752 RepID=UPI00342C3606